MRNLLTVSLAVCVFSTSFAADEQTAPPHAIETPWGTMHSDAAAGWIQLTIDQPQPQLSLPTPLPNITRAFVGTPQWPGPPLQFSFNSDATEITLHLPENVGDGPVAVALETSEASQQLPDGRIVLSALDAEVKGQQAKLETHPGSHRIGFWGNANDYVQWKYPATRPGKYEVQLTYSVAGTAGAKASDIEVTVGDSVLPATLTSTGSWYRYTTATLGTVYLPAKAEYNVAVKCVHKVGGAVMNLKSLTFVPSCEGEMPSQADDGTILLHAQNATVNGTLLQWEPRDIKRTLGYWANQHDSAYWDFVVDQAGSYQVEILQGCGAGQGGSEVQFSFYHWGDGEPIATLPHSVKDTGHWQGFEPLTIGTVTLPAGKTRLRVRAKSKIKVAVMDLRQVQLSPAP